MRKRFMVNDFFFMEDDKILEKTNSPNPRQRDIFYAVHEWVKKYAKYKGISIKLVYSFR